MALSRRPRASVEARDPNDEVFAWPHLLYRELLVALGVIIVLHVVSLVFMAPLEEIADPTRTPNPAKAPWYFLGLQELVHYSALIGGVIVPTLLVLALLALPYVDRSPAGAGRWFAPERRIANAVSPRWSAVVRRADRHRHAVPRARTGPGCGRGSEEPRAAAAARRVRVPRRRVPADLLVGAVPRRGRPSGGRRRRGSGALESDRQEPASARAGRRASEDCGRSGCPISDRVDRCGTCHLGIDDPSVRGRAAALRRRIRERGCRRIRPIDSAARRATTARVRRPTISNAAHQPQPFVARPMRPLETIEANCGACHRALDPPDAPRLAEGRRLIVETGCFSCHEIPGLRRADVPRTGARQPRIQGAPRMARRVAERSEELPARSRRWATSGCRADEIAGLQAFLLSQRAQPPIDSTGVDWKKANTANGRALFGELRCVSCHAVNGRGGTMGPELDANRRQGPTRLAVQLPEGSAPRAAGHADAAVSARPTINCGTSRRSCSRNTARRGAAPSRRR